MKRHSTLTLIFFSSTERQSLTEASVTSDPASEAIRSRESVTREDIDAVSVCSITFTRSFVRCFCGVSNPSLHSACFSYKL